MPLVHVPSTATLTSQRSRGTDGPASAGGGAGERPSSGIFHSMRQRRHSLPRAETTATLPPYEPSAPLTTWTSRGADRFAERSCSIERVKGYLLVLAAFSSMLDKLSTVELPCFHPTGPTAFECAVEGCEGRLSDECKLGLFVEMAVRRFGYWQEKVLSTGSNELPPLDVLLVWVTYLGSPLWYDDDSKLGGKTHPQSVYRDFPLEAVIACIDPDTLEYAPFITEVWKGATGIPFSPVDHMRTSTSASITCPRCQTSFSCPWMSPDRTGYAQCGFKVSCPMTNCRLEVTKEAIGVGRMAKRLVRLYEMPTCQLGTRILTGGLLSHPLEVLFEPSDTSDDMVRRLGNRWAWKRYRAHDFLGEQMPMVDKREINRLMSAFVGSEDASVDLVPSALRHVAFITTLRRLGWLELMSWTVRSEALQTARRRYAKFLTIARAPELLPVPTLGIDIIWQTHLLAASSYRRETCALVGRVVDRDDAVEESFLAAGFKRTAERWKSVNNAPYTTSGTLLPLELRGLAAVRLHIRPLARSQSHSRSRLSLEAKIDYDNPIVYAVADSSLSMPCERNSIAIINDDKAVARRAVRRAEYEACRCEALGRAEEGKVDPDFAARLRDEMTTQPAFMSDAFDHADCGPHGYPVSPSGLMVSGNHLAGRMVSAPWKGNGVVGAGLWRRDDAELAKNPPWNGTFVAGVPSGASTGSNEAHELRDGDKSAYGGKGVSKAVAAVNDILGPALVKSDSSPDDQEGIDRLLIGLDGTPNKSKLGANAILGISMAACRAGAAHKGLELFQHIGTLCDPERPADRTYYLPVPCTNQVNGGVHAGNALAPQEFMLLPVGAKDFEEAMKIASECYQKLKAVISDKFGISGTGVGDEGGFAPPVSSPEEALDLLVEATAKAGHTDKVRFAMDPASSEFFDTESKTYDLDFKAKSKPAAEHRKLSSDQMGDLYRSLVKKYPIILLEDPFAEDDWESWIKFNAEEKGKTELVGDDLLCTNTSIVKTAVQRKACDAMLLKINQVGSITEALEATKFAYSSGWSVFVSHRSGETTDNFIADLVVGVQSGHIKTGAPCRGERLAKYNRLLEIEQILRDKGMKHVYIGEDMRKTHTLQ